jgi:hypothetical protein
MLWSVLAVAFAVEGPSETWVSADAVWVRASPTTESERIGRLAAGHPFPVLERVEGKEKVCAAWGRLQPTGWTCLDPSERTTDTPRDLPVLLDYQPPDPADFDTYLADGTFTRPEGEPILPFLYGRVWKHWKAPIYASVDAFVAGDAPIGRLPVGRRARFVEGVETDQGFVLVAADGTVVPESEIYVFPITRFQGRDLAQDPVPDGHVPAWAVAYAGLEVAGPEGAVTLPYHTAIEVRREPEEGAWIGRIADLEVHIPISAPLRVWRPAERPADVGDSERWVDVDTSQQILAVLEGDTLIYATLVSTGLWSTPTPAGTYRITDKAAWGDMRSRPGAAESYHVEAVPWVLHFRSRYAIHGAYWHWGFGHRASHGCINLAPRDAQWLFDALAPELPTGWHTVWATEERPGTLVRVR